MAPYMAVATLHYCLARWRQHCPRLTNIINHAAQVCAHAERLLLCLSSNRKCMPLAPAHVCATSGQAWLLAANCRASIVHVLCSSPARPPSPTPQNCVVCDSVLLCWPSCLPYTGLLQPHLYAVHAHMGAARRLCGAKGVLEKVYSWKRHPHWHVAWVRKRVCLCVSGVCVVHWCGFPSLWRRQSGKQKNFGCLCHAHTQLVFRVSSTQANKIDTLSHLYWPVLRCFLSPVSLPATSIPFPAFPPKTTGSLTPPFSRWPAC